MPDTNSKPRFRLHSMAIHSLGLVDRGANNKRWLVAKRDEPGAVSEPPVESAPAPAETPVVVEPQVTQPTAPVPTDAAPLSPADAAQPPPPAPAPAPDPAEVEKGKRAKAEQLARLWAAVSSMHELVKDLVDDVTAPPPLKPVAVAAPVESVDSVALVMGEMQKRAHEQEQELSRLRAQHGTPNSIPVDGTPGTPAPYSWPYDMNEIRNQRAGERGQ